MNFNNYSFERMTEDKLIDFYTLFNTRGKDFTFEYFKKKYDTKWFKKNLIGIIVYDNDKNPVGYLGSLPCYVEYKNKKYLTYQISDAVIHPNHIGKGLFAEIIKRLLNVAKEDGVDFLFVFPSPQAYSGFEKTGWVNTGSLHTHKTRTFCLPINKLANKFHLLKWHDAYIKFVLLLISWKRNTTFINSVIDDNTGGVIKNNEYISHKNYSYNYIINLMGFKIWWKIDDGFSIGDIERFDEKQFKKLIKVLRFLCFLLGFHNFKITSSPNTFLDNLFKSSGKSKQGNRIYFYDISTGMDFSKIKFTNSDLNTF